MAKNTLQNHPGVAQSHVREVRRGTDIHAKGTDGSLVAHHVQRIRAARTARQSAHDTLCNKRKLENKATMDGMTLTRPISLAIACSHYHPRFWCARWTAETHPASNYVADGSDAGPWNGSKHLLQTQESSNLFGAKPHSCPKREVVIEALPRDAVPIKL